MSHINPPIIFIDPCNDPNLKVSPVNGTSKSSAQAGVFGVHCAGGNGVQGHSATGVAVRGDSDSSMGVFGRSAKGDGIQGRSAAVGHAGVSAVSETNGFGLYAESRGGDAGHFEGNVNIHGNLAVSGTIDAPKSTITCFDVSISNADCAEEFELTAAETAEPGTVMSLADDGALRPSREPYDRRVAGVVSGAGEYKPGIVLDRQHGRSGRVPIALMGKVYCKVDADHSPVEVGDLLTTSSTPGHAMKAASSASAFGAVIGKALRPLTAGQALVPILIALQ